MDGDFNYESEDEQLAQAKRESLALFEQEKRDLKPNVNTDHRRSTENDEQMARALHESLNAVGGSQSPDAYGWPAKPSEHSYRRHQHQYNYPTTSSSQSSRELRIVFLGMTGSGKSSSANTIVGRKAFKASASGSSVTELCEHVAVKIQGRDVVVVDTPGLFDTSHGNDDTMREITRCVALSAPGPHALVLVVQGGNRASEQTQKCADIIMEVFGDQASRYMIILFTHRDHIEYDGGSISAFVQSLPPKMKQVLQRCDDRYLAFDNRVKSARDKDAQVIKLLSLVDRMVSQNGGRCFTNDVYKDFEEMIVARERKLKDELEKKKEEELRRVNERVEKETQQQLQILQERERQHELSHAEAEEERKRLDAENNEKFDKKLKELEDRHAKQIDNLRGVVRQEVQNDTDGSGDLFDKGMQMFGRGIGHVGDGIKSAGIGIATAAIGIKNVAASATGKVLSFFFGN